MVRVDTLKNRDSFFILTTLLVDHFLEISRKENPEIMGQLPFKNGWIADCHHGDNIMILKITDAPGIQQPLISELNTESIEFLKTLFTAPDKVTFQNAHSKLSGEWFNIDRFTYIGRGKIEKFEDRWKELMKLLWPWKDSLLIPSLYELERQKMVNVIPHPIKVDINAIKNSIWILECETDLKQGTAFDINGLGTVTCEHVLGVDMKAWRATEPNKKYNIKILKRHDIIDLALIEIEGQNVVGLKKGDSTEIKQLDSIAVVGFPNYRVGDSGTIILGHISGFRVVSSIRRLLVSAPLIAGNSGSPILNSRNEVIGVAVTGADKMENANHTENHGVIPIEALDLL